MITGKFRFQAAALAAALSVWGPRLAAQTTNPKDTVLIPQTPPPPVSRVRAAPVRRPPAPLFSGTFTLGATYDNNIIDYSSHDIQQLEAGLLPTKFAVKSPDDMVYGAGLRLDFRPAIWPRRPTRLRFSASGGLYARNGVKNAGRVGLELQQEVFRNASLKGGVDYLPYYYLRNLYVRIAPPGQHYVRARFRRWAYNGAFSYRITRSASLQLRYSYETRTYNTTFKARDSRSNIPGAELDYRFGRFLKLDFAYEYNRTLADGRNSPDSLTEDISYRANDFAWDVFVRPRIWRRHAFQIAQRVAYEFQHYTSDRSYDRYHFRRTDRQWMGRTGVDLELTRYLSAGVAYTVESVTTRSDATFPGITTPPSEVGSYHRQTIGLDFTFSF